MLAQLDQLSGKASFRLSVHRWITHALFWLLGLFSTLTRSRGWRRECAWCGRFLGGRPLAKRVTHGICGVCAYHMYHDIVATPFTQHATRNTRQEDLR